MYQTTPANPVPNGTKARSKALATLSLCRDSAPPAQCSGGFAFSSPAQRAFRQQPKLKAPTRWTARPRDLAASKTQWLRRTLNDPKSASLAAIVGLFAVASGMLLANLLAHFMTKESASLVVGWTLLILAALTPLAAALRPDWFAAAATVPPRLRGALSHISAVMGR